ncbi:MAG: tRNA (adenosine(37)-N6)-threonylcarbamoyltransferase complex dimerization subunit type 1 TsaB [Clostridiales bacterium]|nr:tRNA (adenosine(37)-N6)-threonylcarbamoyltransferase complex dimerization subunit type 1 TsaB [Clostridiales bacterium]MDY4180485.1 tRNA (adenosine(37)-N6)-threonylcarbamoyltransferase complex dimerization subunit type 1 TsaB [Pseudoflavonifractor sp.]
MKILAIESSATACSVALCEDERLVAQSFQNNGLTHSRTLMPMLEHMLDSCGAALEEMDLIAVAAGPGSFTGLRIGVAAAKGLAWPGEKPCAGVSTLEAMAWTAAHMGMEICPVMDARRHQVYNARFRGDGEKLERLAPDRAISLEELGEELKRDGKPQILIGDGAVLCYTTLKELGLDIRLAPPHLRFQSAWGVARAALEQARTGVLTDARGLAPVYHRLSQAERERLARLNCGGPSADQIVS